MRNYAYILKFLSYSIGRINPNSAPIPFSSSLSLFFPQIFPLCASIIFFDIYKPNPVPLSYFVANFVKSLDNISLSIPIPVSFVITLILSFLSLLAVIVILPFSLPSVNRIALHNRLSKT